jgi:hypothetical protein
MHWRTICEGGCVGHCCSSQYALQKQKACVGSATGEQVGNRYSRQLDHGWIQPMCYTMAGNRETAHRSARSKQKYLERIKDWTLLGEGDLPYALLGNIRFSMSTPIWRSFAPLKCKIFGWLVIRDRPRSERRYLFGIENHINACYICLQEEDNMNHIFVQCGFARQAWHNFFR